MTEGTNKSGPLTLFSAGRISDLYLRMEEQDRYCHFYTIHALFGDLIVECFSYAVSPGRWLSHHKVTYYRAPLPVWSIIDRITIMLHKTVYNPHPLEVLG